MKTERHYRKINKIKIHTPKERISLLRRSIEQLENKIDDIKNVDIYNQKRFQREKLEGKVEEYKEIISQIEKELKEKNQ